jgi:hypothetical protein
MSATLNFPKVQSKAQWGWSTPPAGEAPIALTYPSKNNATKSGVMPTDLQNFIGIPLTTFNPTLPIPDSVVIGWIRYAEDKIEQDTNIRLCQTWIAAPPAKTSQQTTAINIGVQYNYQQLGVDYDFEEPAYDFRMDSAQDNGWMYTHLRWRPVKGVDLADPSGIVNASNLHGTQNIAFIYPLLNEFFRAPQNWIVEDQNRGLVRLVPATNTQMLPLFAMQLAFMGTTASIPGGLWFQYLAGLTANDYNANWSFMTQLVLVRTAIRALRMMQMSINLGVTEGRLQVDGMMRSVKYDAKGPFAGQIGEYESEEKALLKTARSKCGMPYLGIL